jgi:hypothetical protein
LCELTFEQCIFAARITSTNLLINKRGLLLATSFLG